jgi:hypothetical protein
MTLEILIKHCWDGLRCRDAGCPVTSPILKVQEEKSVKPSRNENCTCNKAGLIILIKISIMLFMQQSIERPCQQIQKQHVNE